MTENAERGKHKIRGKPILRYSHAFHYKRWANRELLALSERQFDKLPSEEATFIVRILNHTAVVDSLFISRLQGETEKYSADNTVQTPSLADLRSFAEENDSWLVDYSSSVSDEHLQDVISFQFTDGDQGRLSVEEIFMHLLTHGSNHRGMASRTLASNGLDRPKDTFTRFLHEFEPQRRFS